ncbi:iron-containing alcohol dehydrogenase [Paenibacillus alginolyticus]|nr:iron-containing alcohol dehydrogenase [Paenibacillus alginolyticus]
MKSLQGYKAMIVIGGQSVKVSGYLEKVEAYLKEPAFKRG